MCICGKKFNLKVIQCDTCDEEFHIPCVQEEIVRQKDRIFKSNSINPNYQDAYSCPRFNCSGHIIQKEAIPYKNYWEYNKTMHGTLMYIDWQKHKIKNYALSISGFILFIYMILSIVLYSKYASEVNNNIDDINRILTNITADEYEIKESNKIFTVMFSSMIIVLYSGLLGTYFVICNKDMISTLMNLIPVYLYILLSVVLFALSFKRMGDIEDKINDVDIYSSYFNRNTTIDTLYEYGDKLADKEHSLWLMMSLWLFAFVIGIVCVLVMILVCAIVIGASNLYSKIKSKFTEKDYSKDIVMNRTHIVSVDL